MKEEESQQSPRISGEEGKVTVFSFKVMPFTTANSVTATPKLWWEINGVRLTRWYICFHVCRDEWKRTRDLEWAIFPQLVHPAEDAQHQLLLLYTMEEWRLGGSVCVFLTPSRSSLKKGDKVILPVSSFFAFAITFSHTRGGGKRKKVTTTESKETEGKKTSWGAMENRR